jgi:FtsP/CotA-like multicopper oxidase with cupredoxin domain
MWYHDHVHGSTSKHAYYGQTGIYIVKDPAEDALQLPAGQYDVPLALTDKAYQSNGDLARPDGDINNFFGDVIQVNEQPWPYLQVEPRKYRFRLFDMSLSRPYNLYFVADDNQPIPFQVIASDSGLFASPVTTKDVLISMGERYEIIFDFSAYAEKNITLLNNLPDNLAKQFDNTDKVMRFTVGKTVSDSSNNGAVPSRLNGNINWPMQRTTVDHSFNFQFGGTNTWTINGVTFDDVNNRVLARPPQGTVQLWELKHSGGPSLHPVHIHLVNMQVISRSGGSRGLLPYEAAGFKDIVLLEPFETVRVLAMYGPWNGMYMFHCHNLIHEDHAMIDVFNVTKLEALGYGFNSTQVYANPMDAEFAPLAYNAQDFSLDAEINAVSSLAALNAYSPASSLMAAESSYWATATQGEVSSADGLGGLLTGLFGRRIVVPSTPAPLAVAEPLVLPRAVAPRVTAPATFRA